MYDIPELERKWKIYKRRQIRKPLIIGGVTLLTLVAASFIAYTYLDYGKKEIPTPPQIAAPAPAPKKVAAKEEEKKIIIKTTPINPQKEPEVAKVANSAKSAEEEQVDIVNLANATVAKLNIPEEEVRIIEFDDKGKNEAVPKQYDDVLIPKQSTKEIKEKEMIKEVEERFRATQDPKDSLWLARYYYKKGDYEKAETWAINTNNIDGEIEESWIIFAKARAKQGHRVDAIKVLQSYYDETGSAKAKELLDKLRRGKPFK